MPATNVIRWASAALLGLGLVACGGGTAGPSDAAGLDAATSPPCATDSDCSDGRFCTGIERCAPDAAAADERGCIAPREPACAADRVCNEDEARCEPGTSCDRDDDGVRGSDCGGPDCDDDDPDRFPGNSEVCDAAGHDEDCRPETFGERDADRDGYFDAACCDTSSGTQACGNDCDDTDPAIHPDQLESCDTPYDDNCDGAVNEGCECLTSEPPRQCGTSDVGECAFGIQRCIAGRWETSCAGAIEPAARETCNGLDDDCDGAMDEQVVEVGTPCASPSPGRCRDGHTQCAGTAGLVCQPDIAPFSMAETCNNVDDDCDGPTDEGNPGGGAACGSSTGVCRPGTRTCVSGSLTCTGATGPGSEACNGLDDDCDSRFDETSECRQSSSGSCSVCGGIATGIQRCTSTCTWVAECDVGGVGAISSWAPDSPYLSHPSGGSMSTVTPSWFCPATHVYSERVCQDGPGVILGPADYQVSVRATWQIDSSADSSPGGLRVVVRSRTTGAVFGTASLPAAPYGAPVTTTVSFTVPTGGCHAVDFRLVSDRNTAANLYTTTLTRLTHIRLPAP